ncbi:DNA-(apurinic or apyrimidinic site) endonuclease 2-like [Diadema antillarum]|uniref:DNA-(apurinic or apyrimidinic site) endonuclease 2-like n=1 Tax=Diadema antillarum TaxID=105358 RepID=UPI003A8827E8
MKVLTWNINGIRACKIPLRQLFDSLDAEVICLQETKLTRDQLDDDIVNVENYNAYFSFSKKRSGYSGVVTYCRNDYTPVLAEEGITGLLSSKSKQLSHDVVGHYGDQSSFTEEELKALDAEGRTIITEHRYMDQADKVFDLVIINVYCPRADFENQERVSYKLGFYRALQLRAEALCKAGKSVIIVGDVNASHRRIDHCNPDESKGHFESHPSRRWLDGFLKDVHSPTAIADEETPESSQENGSASPSGEEDEGEIEHLNGECSRSKGDAEKDEEDKSFVGGDDSLLEGDAVRPEESKLFVDTFRFFHPKRKDAFTCWSTVTSARQTNYGTRIDYIIADEKLCVEEFTDCDIMPEFEGSDHCPVKATLAGRCSPAKQLHPLCAKLMPEFSGKQQKLSSFFQKVSPSKKFELHEKLLASADQQKGGGFMHSAKRGAQPLNGKPSKKIKTDKKGVKSGNIASFFKQRTPSVGNVVTTSTRVGPDVCHTSAVSCGIDSDAAVLQDSVKTPESTDPLHSSRDTREEPGSTCNSTSEPESEAGSHKNATGEASDAKVKARSQLSSQWRNLLKGPPAAPLCKGHKEPCVLRTVKKAGPNVNKQFFVCRRPEGHKNNPEARCNHFEWVSKR